MDSPLRMCIACREMKDKRSLLRIVKGTDGTIKLDHSFKAAGRGAYVCKQESCVKRLVKGKLLARAFKCEVPQNVYGEIEEYVYGEQ